MATEQLSEQLKLVMQRQGALENALMQERQARAEAEQRLSAALVKLEVVLTRRWQLGQLERLLPG